MSSSSSNTNNNDQQFENCLKRTGDAVRSSFSKKFKDSSMNHGPSLEILKQLKENTPNINKTKITLLRQLEACSRYEAWFQGVLNDEGYIEGRDTDPYSNENFTLGKKCCQIYDIKADNFFFFGWTIDKLLLFTIERAACSTGIVQDVLQVKTVYVEFELIVSEVIPSLFYLHEKP